MCLLILCLCTAWPSGVRSQDNFENPVFINKDSGLPSNRINALARDHLGYLWVGTDKGLCRFDGTYTQVFQPSEQDSASIGSEIILDLLPDSTSGKLWIATFNCLSVYDYRDGKFRNFLHVPGKKYGPPDFHPYRLFKDRDGQLWVSFRERGLYRYRPETDDFIHVLCAPAGVREEDPACFSFYQMAADPENDSLIWMASKGLVRFNRFTFETRHYTYSHPDEKTEAYANSIRCLFLPGNGKVYFGAWYEGVFVLDQRSGKISRFDPACVPDDYSLGKGVVTGFYPKSAHEFWISSWKGMQLFDAKRNCVTRTWNNNVKQKKWYSVDLIDEHQRIWSASDHLGLLVHNPVIQQFQTSYYEDETAAELNLTRKILEDTLRKKLYVLPQGGKGLYILDQPTGKWSVVPPDHYDNYDNNGFAGWDMTFLNEDKIFIVENSHFYEYTPGDTHLRRFHLQPAAGNPRMRKVQKDRQGLLWVTGYGQPVQRIDLRRNRIHTFEKELQQAWKGPLGADYIEEDKNGNIWMRENNGLLVFKRPENQFLYIIYEAGNSRAFRGMGHIEAGLNGDIWIATNKNSLGYAHADSASFGILRHFTRADGLIGKKVLMVKLVEDQLLVFTDEAIQWFDTKTKKFGAHFFLGYGLGSFDPAATVLASGVLAVGKRKAVSFFQPGELLTNRELPKPYVASFKVFDKEWPLNPDFNRLDSVFLSHRQNFFSFEFSSIGFNLSSDIKYYYKLEGFDEDWQDGAKRRFASYTNVPGGDYLFQVKAVNNEGLSVDKPFTVYLHISTVWWKTWWFWSLTGFVLLGIGIKAYNYRIGQVRKEERLKTEFERKLADVELSALRAQMNPHFIFNSLNSIEYYILNNEPEKASDYLNRFSRLIRLILQNSKSTVVPLKDDLEALRLYLEMESMRFDNLFEYEVKVEKDLDLERNQVPPMLLQPYVENAIWHGLMQKEGEKGRLNLLLRRENGQLLCIIEDNGIGREAAQRLRSKSGAERKSFGMKITGDRLALLNKISKANASVKVFDMKDSSGVPSGTRVELLIPV